MATFAEALFGLSTDRLRALVEARQIEPKKLALVPTKRQLAQFLANELSRPQSVVTAILQCNARELRLLQLMIGGQETQATKWADVIASAGNRSLTDTLEAIVTRLENLGLAFRVGTETFVPEAVRAQIPASLSDRYSLARCLNAYDAMAVKRVYDELGLKAPGAKPHNIQKIVEYLTGDPNGLPLTRELDSEEEEVLEYLVQVGGSATPIEVATAAMNGNTDAFFRYDWQNRWKQGREQNAVDRLLARGIIYVVSHGYGFNLFLVIPGDLLRILSGATDAHFWTSPPPTPTPLESPPVHIVAHPVPIRDVVSLLAFMTTQEAARTNTGHIHKTALKNIARTLRLPNERYASFLYAVCREAGLISSGGNERQVYSVTPRGLSWLHWDGAAQMRALVTAWREGDLWGEMYSDPLRKENAYRPKDGMVRIREAALRLIAGEGAGVGGQGPEEDAALTAERTTPTPGLRPLTSFLDIDSVADAMAFQSPLLMVQSAMMGPDLAPSPTTFVRQLVSECLSWLGLAELAFPTAPDPTPIAPAVPSATKGKGVRGSAAALLRAAEELENEAPPEATGYRLTALGRTLLSADGANVEIAEEPREDQVIVQANAEIFIPPYLDPATFYRLLTISEPAAKGATGNTITLTRDSIRRALDTGETTRELLSFLQAHSRTGIPQNVEYLINEVGGRHGHVHIGRAQMYLQTDTALLMKELQARKELKGQFVRNLSETVAVLNSEDPEKLLRELRKAGYAPVSDDAPKRSVAISRPTSKPPAEADITPAKADSRDAKRIAKLDTALDWKRIAQDDDKPWKSKDAAREAVMFHVPDNAITDPTRIKVLINQGVLNGKPVEVAYSLPGENFPSIDTITPRQIAGTFVYAVTDDGETDLTLSLRQILWARPAES